MGNREHRSEPWLALFAAALLCFTGCPEDPLHDDDAADDDDTGDDDTGDDDTGDDDATGDDDDTECPDDMICVESFPFTEINDTSHSDLDEFDSYSCSPDTDESGSEIVYRVTLPSPGFLMVSIDDSTAGVDIDAHLLGSLDADDCLDRGNFDAASDVSPPYAYVVADTYVPNGTPQAGEYEITIGHIDPHQGDCSMETGWLDRVNDGGNPLQMPATGPVVLEAHLVTDEENFAGGWPGTITDGIEDHYERSQDETEFVMTRDQSWCPQEGCEYGQGSSSKPTVGAEAWYVCMYWADKPAIGTKMIVMDGSGRAVVAAAGYETGPGDLGNIGGACEEIHHYFGTGHQDELTYGFAMDQTLPYGPIDCQ